MPNIFLKISDLDLTPFVDIQNHAVNRNDVYQSWTDGNWVERRERVRTRIEGETTVGFAAAADFEQFTRQLSAARQSGGYYAVTVYVNNTGEEALISAFLSAEGEGKWDLRNGRQWITQKITITER